MSNEDVEYGIAPSIQGHITSMDLIDSIAGVTFWLRRDELSSKDGKLFFIKSGFYFVWFVLGPHRGPGDHEGSGSLNNFINFIHTRTA